MRLIFRKGRNSMFMVTHEEEELLGELCARAESGDRNEVSGIVAELFPELGIEATGLRMQGGYAALSGNMSFNGYEGVGVLRVQKQVARINASLELPEYELGICDDIVARMGEQAKPEFRSVVVEEIPFIGDVHRMGELRGAYRRARSALHEYCSRRSIEYADVQAVRQGRDRETPYALRKMNIRIYSEWMFTLVDNALSKRA